MDLPLLLVVIIVLALIFDYINGFHDSANAITSIVSTKVLTPFQAVVWAAFWNFASFFLAFYVIGEFKIGNTIAKVVNEDFINLHVIFAGLVAAIIWNLLTWWFGIPSSSSHTLIGGFLGAALTHAFMVDFQQVISVQPNLGILETLKEAFHAFSQQHIVKNSKLIPIILFIFLAPIIGMITSVIITLIITNLARNTNPHRADKVFKRVQLFSSALFSLGHGTNDAQKVMGIIGAAVIYYHVTMLGDPLYTTLDSSHRFEFFVEHYWWVPFISYTMIALGTMSGGWKIVKTMGTRITKINSLEGVSADTSGAFTLFFAEYFGIPVSTTHTVTGSIIGVGLAKRVSAVRWGITFNLLWAWILTIPISALMAAATYFILYFTL